MTARVPAAPTLPDLAALPPLPEDERPAPLNHVGLILGEDGAVRLADGVPLRRPPRRGS